MNKEMYLTEHLVLPSEATLSQTSELDGVRKLSIHLRRGICGGASRWGGGQRGGRCGDGAGLFLQFEGIFDAGDLVEEGFVDLETLLYRVAGVDHRGVVAAANQLANA